MSEFVWLVTVNGGDRAEFDDPAEAYDFYRLLVTDMLELGARPVEQSSEPTARFKIFDDATCIALDRYVRRLARALFLYDERQPLSTPPLNAQPTTRHSRNGRSGAIRSLRQPNGQLACEAAQQGADAQWLLV